MLPFSSFIFAFFALSSLIVCSHAINSDFSVELIHRDSYKSPLYNPTQTKFQQIINDAHRSINRSNYINQKISLTKTKFESSLTYDDGAYLISYYDGTPPFKVYAFLDSGSNLIWIQCKPCNVCFNQTSPIFNPSKSSSYKNIPCYSSRCKTTEAETFCSKDRDACQYTLGYDLNTNTQGDLILETITLKSTFGSMVSFPKIMIGCGYNNSFYSGKSSGIVGLGTGPLSLIRQLGSFIDERFSYCLVDDTNVNLSSKLNFGDAAKVSGKNVVSTPMVKLVGNQQEEYYYLTLKAVSVGSKRIKYKGFKNKGVNASTHNILIDSGTTVTFVPRHFYHKLESTVKKVVKLERFHDDSGNYNLCYNTTLKKNTSKPPNFPVITAHFSGGDVKLDSKGSFKSLSKEIKCLAIFPQKYDFAIFGNKAQVNYLVGYDLKKNIVSFKPTDCSKY
ncbi:aspartic proteinase CDR1-like [Vicia villosa]|uniref:aspartic proteinase CDR1-like n=1 Tax=Vicia villosa TaxID=3911 RepID=UPI00273CDACB|nr:aspartic proteinase CDR1-like [Vicia villosa]